jgi:4-hydroxymandelate oxidase
LNTNTIEPKLDFIPNEIVCVDDYENFAKTRVDTNTWAYISSASADEITYKANKKAFDKISLLSRTLEDVKGGNTKLNLFGHEYAHPIFLAPVAYQKLVHPDGEIASAQAANAMEACMLVSGFSSTSLEDISDYTNSPLWFQLYMQIDMKDNLFLINKAESLGYKALVITIDAPIAGIRNKEQKAGFCLPEGVEAVNIKGMKQLNIELQQGQSTIFDGVMAYSPTWEDIKFIKANTKLPVILKGLTHPSYAKKAVKLGIDGIIVSNHGGRTLDTLPATIDILPKIVEAVDGKIPVLLDGGIRRGTDIIKALSYGASAVLVGRPIMFALATSGALGVAHILKILRDELEISMALTGCKTLKNIIKDVVF